MAQNIVRFRLEGTEALTRFVRRMSREARGALVEAVSKKAAQPVLAGVRRRVPVDTGLLKNSIQATRPRVGRARAVVRVGADRRTLESARGGGKDGGRKTAPYDRFQEFGTRHHAARPFLRPGLDATRRTAVKAGIRELDRRIAPHLKGGR